MANMMARIFNAVADQVVRWLCAIVFCASISMRAMLTHIKRAGLALFSTGVVPVVGQLAGVNYPDRPTTIILAGGGGGNLG